MPSPGYILIAIDEFVDFEENDQTARGLASYLVNEFDNHRLINGTITSFETLDNLKARVGEM